MNPSLKERHKGRSLGHDTVWDPDSKKWKWADSGEMLSRRECKHCGKLPTEEGYDACLGKVEGAYSVCCGHGIDPGYILWEGNKVTQLNSKWLHGIRIVEE